MFSTVLNRFSQSGKRLSSISLLAFTLAWLLWYPSGLRAQDQSQQPANLSLKATTNAADEGHTTVTLQRFCVFHRSLPLRNAANNYGSRTPVLYRVFTPKAKGAFASFPLS